jgi:deazaflavin-dependent oxidoreductase (nitroreductase family)
VDGVLHGLDPAARAAFKALNRWFMVPVLRAGLGGWLGSPIGGWMLLLRVRGRRSGIVRETPLSYLIAEGSIWVVAGFGPDTQWYRNLLADPLVEVVLPGRRVAATAVEVLEPAARARVIPALVRATGLPSFLGGMNPWRDDDEAILRATDFVPLLRIDPLDGPIAAGPDDPGGSAWIRRQAIVLAGSLAAAAVLGGAVRALRRRGQLPS